MAVTEHKGVNETAATDQTGDGLKVRNNGEYFELELVTDYPPTNGQSVLVQPRTIRELRDDLNLWIEQEGIA